MSYDPAEMFRRLMMGQGQPPAGPAPAVSEPAAAATSPEEAPAQDNTDILRSIMLGSSGGIVEGRPDPIGGINHQGRAQEAFKKIAMQMATGGGGGGSGGGK